MYGQKIPLSQTAEQPMHYEEEPQNNKTQDIMKTIKANQLVFCLIFFVQNCYISRDMGIPTMWYVRPAKPQTSLRIRAVWSEPLLVA